MRRRRDTVIAHVGIFGDRPGGIAQVINQYLTWQISGYHALGVLSTRGRRDWASPFFWARAAVILLFFRLTSGRAVVLVHLSASGSFVREGSLAIWARLLGHRVGIHLHGSRFPMFAAKRPALVRTVCRASQVVFVLTDESLSILRHLLSGSETRLVLLSNVVSLPPSFGPKERTILFGGEIGERKGVDLLVAAWELLGTARDGWSLVLAGPIASGFDQTLLDRRGVINLGAIPHADLLALESRASIAVLPSRNEAMPMFLLESMARGCAVVSTAVGQIEELVRGVGMVVDPEDVQGLARALRKFIEDSSAMEQAGAASRRRIEHAYAPARVRGLLESEWTRLIAKEPTSE